MKILLLHFPFDKFKKCSSFIHSSGETLPLGLLSLRELAPDSIEVFDGRDCLARLSELREYSNRGFKTVLVQPSRFHTENELSPLYNSLKQALPDANIILSQSSIPQNDHPWDGVLIGTGKFFLENLLLGKSNKNRVISTLKEDFVQELPFPKKPDRTIRNLFKASVEKSEISPAVSVYRPWLGLLDRSNCHFSESQPPSKNFLTGLFEFLAKSGFKSIFLESFRGDCEGLEVALNVLQSMKNFPVSFNAIPSDELLKILELKNDFGKIIRKIWISSEDHSLLARENFNFLLAIRKMGFKLGIRIHSENFADVLNAGFLNWFDSISFENPAQFKPSQLRKIAFRHYFANGNLPRILLRIKNLTDLINFLKICDDIFEVTFT
ncbi:MAG: hypothetical protein HQM08_05525 [Candidatus Riflebacteria bacterium]|nr:hypothetical protein [Candidatus Riflebacteria bacterium]